jgi:phospholipase/carboxylesterase
MGVFDEKDLAFRIDEMKVFIEKVLQENHLENAKIIALGYSNGANIAGATLLKYPNFLMELSCLDLCCLFKHQS